MWDIAVLLVWYGRFMHNSCIMAQCKNPLDAYTDLNGRQVLNFDENQTQLDEHTHRPSCRLWLPQYINYHGSLYPPRHKPRLNHFSLRQPVLKIPTTNPQHTTHTRIVWHIKDNLDSINVSSDVVYRYIPTLAGYSNRRRANFSSVFVYGSYIHLRPTS